MEIQYYVDDASSRVLQVSCDGEIKKVVDGIAGATELVNHLIPDKTTVIPYVSDNDRPSTKLLYNFFERFQTNFFSSSYTLKENNTKIIFFLLKIFDWKLLLFKHDW